MLYIPFVPVKLHESLPYLLLARKSKKNFELLKDYLSYPNVKIVWGDLLDYDSILEGITGADYVLHIGGMVSPAADYKPYTTLKTNSLFSAFPPSLCPVIRGCIDPLS